MGWIQLRQKEKPLFHHERREERKDVQECLQMLEWVRPSAEKEGRGDRLQVQEKLRGHIVAVLYDG